MDSRYQHPQVTALWDLPWTYDAWWRIEQAIARAQINLGIIDREQAEPLVANAEQPDFTPHEFPYVLDQIHAKELKTKHDVAAFVAVMRDWWGEPHARWIHFGVTSSDIVDTAQGLRFKALTPTLEALTTALVGQLARWECDDTVVLGRTHGQPAEPTFMRARVAHWAELVGGAVRQLVADTRGMQIAKVAGPVGSYSHNPPAVEMTVATYLHLSAQQHGASQIAPRGALARWANSASELVAACAKIAMDYRLMNLLGEAWTPQAKEQVGSSVMAHKNNPIRAEQITGMQRLAAGYASMLQPLDLWLERDISHSSVERVAVPDLWHVVLHVVDQTTQLLADMELRTHVISMRLEDDANAVMTAHTTVEGIRDGMSAEDARKFALEFNIESYDFEGDVRAELLCNYPWKTPGSERA